MPLPVAPCSPSHHLHHLQKCLGGVKYVHIHSRSSLSEKKGWIGMSGEREGDGEHGGMAWGQMVCKNFSFSSGLHAKMH